MDRTSAVQSSTIKGVQINLPVKELRRVRPHCYLQYLINLAPPHSCCPVDFRPSFTTKQSSRRSKCRNNNVQQHQHNTTQLPNQFDSLRCNSPISFSWLAWATSCRLGINTTMISSLRKSTSCSSQHEVHRMSCSGEDHYSAFLLHSTPHEPLELSSQQQQKDKCASAPGSDSSGSIFNNSRRTSTNGMLTLWGNTISRRRDSSAAFTSATQASSMDFFTIDNTNSCCCSNNDAINCVRSKYANEDLEELLKMAVTDGPIRALPSNMRSHQRGKATGQQPKLRIGGSFRRSMRVATSKLLPSRRRTPPAA